MVMTTETTDKVPQFLNLKHFNTSCIKTQTSGAFSHFKINFDSYMQLTIYSCNFVMTFRHMHLNFCPLRQILSEDGTT